MPASYAEDDLAVGRAALLSGWSSGSEPGLVITRASGALVWDSKGSEYIDCTSMAWSNNIGASAPEVVEAAFAQARQLSHLRSNFDSIPLLLLSKAMTESAPGDLKRIGFTLHGSLAVEMAMKLAMLNRPHHTGPWLALTDGYHGRSLASMGLGWPHTNHAFDRAFLVKAAPPDIAHQLLVAEVRSEMLALPTARLEYDDGSEHSHHAMVVFAVGGLVESPGILNRMLRVVTTLARVRMTTVAYR